jgi:hypothetical protein
VAKDARNKTGGTLGAIGRAATGLVNLGVAGTAAVGAAALHSWPILALGGATYAALVAWDAVRGPTARPAKAEATTMREPDAYRDQAIRSAVRTLTAARIEVDRVLDDTPEDVKAHLALALVSVDDLVTRAAGLAARGDDLAAYLATKDPRVVQHDAEDLRKRAARTTDPEARAQYEAARASREEHLKVLEDLANAKERIVASLLSIASSLEALPAKVVRMRALDADAMDKLTGDVNDELARVNGEIKTFEETLVTLGEVGA